MRPIHRPHRRHRAPGLVDQAPHAVRIIHLPRHKNVELVRKADQPPIEHPVHRAGQRQPVLHRVRSVGPDRTDMRRFDLGPPAAVDQLV
jgi:hypothetical protein